MSIKWITDKYINYYIDIKKEDRSINPPIIQVMNQEHTIINIDEDYDDLTPK
jgi:hypothetical protein